MARIRSRLVLWTSSFAAAMVIAVSAQQSTRTDSNWPQFRGPAAAGIAEGHSLPTHWNVEKGERIRWNVAIPGLAHSSPVVWGELVCVTTAVAAKPEDLKVGLYGDIAPVSDSSPLSWEVHCVDKQSGAKRWSAVAHKGVPRVKRHPKSTHANSTLATDGRTIVAMFGSEGLYAYDLKSGALLWKKDLGRLESGFFQVPSATWGFASSPVIHEGRVIIQADVLNGSFLASFNVATGQEIWRTPRNDYPTWSTPAVHVANGRAQIIVNGFKHVGGYDFHTGKEVWRMNGGGDIPVPTPIVKRDLIFVTNAHGPAAPIFAVRTNASGDISLADNSTTNSHIAWSQRREGAYMQTPIVYGDYLYVCRDNGVLSVFEAETGKRLYQERLADGRTGFSASAVAGDGKVYYTSEEGSVVVIKAGPVFEQIAENLLGETAMATPAISEGTLFFRTRTRLIAVAS